MNDWPRMIGTEPTDMLKEPSFSLKASRMISISGADLDGDLARASALVVSVEALVKQGILARS